MIHVVAPQQTRGQTMHIGHQKKFWLQLIIALFGLLFSIHSVVAELRMAHLAQAALLAFIALFFISCVIYNILKPFSLAHFI